jgi:hypothetical protein
MTTSPLTGHPAPPTPPTVPGYAVHSLLGFGSHGEVWLGEDVVSGATVALKLGRPPDPGPDAEGDGEAAATALRREIALLARIDDPHVVRLHRVVALEDGLALVLEHAAGGNLGSLVASRGALDPPEVTTLVVPLGQALDRLHARGVVHGDLSPGNVLFAADGRPLLSDLGVARVLGTTGPGSHGTPGFVDPARAGGVDPRASDVWGLAALGWFALTGRPPGETTAGAVALTAPGLTRLLAEVLGADPPERPSPAELAHRAWEAVRPAPIRLLPARSRLAAAEEALSRRTTRRMTAAPEPEAAPTPPERRPRMVPRRPRPRPDSARRGRPRPDGAGRAGSRAGGADRGRSRAGHLGRAQPRSDDAGHGRPAAAALAGRVRGDGRGHAPEPLPASRFRDESGRAPSRPVEPVRAGPSGDVDRRRRDVVAGHATRRRRSGRVLLPVTGVLGLVVVPVVAGFLWWGERIPRPGPPPAPPRAVQPHTTELTAAVDAIGRARAQAFAAASPQALAAADEAGSPAMAYDTAVVRGLTERGWRLSGVAYVVRDLRVVDRAPASATVTAAVTTSAHRRVTAAGALVAEVPAEGPRTVRLTLVEVPGAGWRVRAVS